MTRIKFPVQVHLKLPRDLAREVERCANENFDTTQSWIRRTLAQAVLKRNTAEHNTNSMTVNHE